MGTQTCRGTDELPTIIEDEEDAPTHTVAAVPVLLILVLVLAIILVLVLVLVKSEEAGVRDVAVTDFFFFLGGAPPLRPLPLGIPVNTKFVILFGRFLAFTNQSTNPFSSPSISAAATLWEQIPRDL